MTDETREEIVRLARKGYTSSQIEHQLLGHGSPSDREIGKVIDRTEGEANAAIAPTDTDTDPIGRIAKWLGEARVAGYNDREIAAMLVEGTALGVHIRGRNSDRADMAKRLADQLDQMASSEERTGPIGQ